MLIYLGTFAASVGIAAYGEHLRTKKTTRRAFISAWRWQCW